MRNVHVCNIGISSIHGKELLGHLSFHHEDERSQEYRNFDRIDDEPMEFEWNIFPGFNTLQLSQEVKSLLLRLGETPENFTGRIVLMSLFNDISCGSKDNEKKNTSPMLNSFLYMRKDLNQDDGHFSVLVQRKSGILSVQIVHKVNGTESLN